ncbi:TPA: hypothetical protein ACKQCJ_004395, partial [Stenotrophomonas maltophilia]
AFDRFLRSVGGGLIVCCWWVSTLVDTMEAEKFSAHEKSPPDAGGLFRLSGCWPQVQPNSSNSFRIR